MSKRQEPELFPEFWEIWRKHARHTDGRGLARDAFAKHVKNGANPQDIVDGARAFFRTMKDRDREFVPLSATWLNRESYSDLAEQQRAHEAKVQENMQRKAEASANVVQMPASQTISPERRAEMVAQARQAMRNGQ